MSITVKTKTVTTTDLAINKEELIRILNEAFQLYPSGERYKIPQDAQVWVTIPGGGDWSSTDLHLDRDVKLNVSWSDRS